MVVLNREGQKNCYIAHKDNPLGVRSNFSKLADFIAEYE